MELKVELVGNRPCMDNMDMDELKTLSDFVCSVQEKYGCCKVERGSGSTDANIPHSLGIPAICVGRVSMLSPIAVVFPPNPCGPIPSSLIFSSISTSKSLA